MTAKNIIEQFILNNSENADIQEIQQYLGEVNMLIDKNNYNNLQQSISKENLPSKLETYNEFLSKFPNSNYNVKIKEEIKLIRENFINGFEKKLILIEKNKTWNIGINLCQEALTILKNSEYEAKVYQFLKKYKNNRQKEIEIQKSEWNNLLAFVKNTNVKLNERIIKIDAYLKKTKNNRYRSKAKSLKKELIAEKKALDDEKKWNEILSICRSNEVPLCEKLNRINVYQSNNIPQKYFEKAAVIKEEMAEKCSLEKRLLKTISASSNSVFEYEGKGIFHDKRTNLSWRIFNPSTSSNDCIKSYDVNNYLKKLRAGNYKDWRKPTLDELNFLFFSENAFPLKVSKWYYIDSPNTAKDSTSVATSGEYTNMTEFITSNSQCASLMPVRYGHYQVGN